MKKLKINLALIAMILAATAAFAFKPATVKPGQKPPVTWHYNAAAATEAAFRNGNNWGTSSTGSCAATGTRPCSIVVQDITTQADLTEYLDDFTGAQILGMSSQRKP